MSSRTLTEVLVGKLRDTLRYSVPSLHWAWSLGAVLLGVLVFQIVSGLLITTYYSAYGMLSFWSVDSMTRRSSAGCGFYLRLAHQTGVSMLFAAMLMHIARAEIYGLVNHCNAASWNLGVALYIVFIITAFTGYACVYGNMSHWAVNVILSTVKTIPYVGGAAVFWFLNGSSFLGDVVPRMFTIHYLMPLVGMAMVVFHLSAVHSYQSTGPTAILPKPHVEVDFFPAYIIRDVFLLTCFGLVYAGLMLLTEDPLVDRVNYEPANPFLVPRHIVPEWYLLPWYAILRSVPHKVAGLLLVCALLISRFTVETEVKFTPAGMWETSSDNLFVDMLAQLCLITCGALSPGVASFVAFGMGVCLMAPEISCDRNPDMGEYYRPMTNRAAVNHAVMLWARPGSSRVSGRVTAVPITVVSIVWYLFGMLSDFNRARLPAQLVESLTDVWSPDALGWHISALNFFQLIGYSMGGLKEETDSEGVREGYGLLTRMEWNRTVILYLLSECFAFAGLIWGWGNGLDGNCIEHDPKSETSSTIPSSTPFFTKYKSYYLIVSLGGGGYSEADGMVSLAPASYPFFMLMLNFIGSCLIPTVNSLITINSKSNLFSPLTNYSQKPCVAGHRISVL